MSALQETADDLPLGALVDITGVVVGRSEFATGRPTYLVEFERRGKVDREWFFADDLGECGGDADDEVTA